MTESGDTKYLPETYIYVHICLAEQKKAEIPSFAPEHSYLIGHQFEPINIFYWIFFSIHMGKDDKYDYFYYWHRIGLVLQAVAPLWTRLLLIGLVK